MNVEEVKIALRLPVDVRDRVQSNAKRNRRSMNGEIVYQLERLLRSDSTETASGDEIGVRAPDAAENLNLEKSR